MKRIIVLISEKGLSYIFKIAYLRTKRFFYRYGIYRPRIPKLNLIRKLLRNKNGIEIGGPSRIFDDDGFIPVYKSIHQLDGCNFSNSTIWEGEIKQGLNYVFHKDKKGVQYISEATSLSLIPDLKYDFLLSSNCLEHVANPIKAIEEWIRILKDDGIILLILPNKKYCFDHKRAVTRMDHLLDDYKKNINEDDLTHLDEILDLHDLEMDQLAGSYEEFKERSLKNFKNRTLHHHVFDSNLLSEIFNLFNIEILHIHEGQDYSILGRKSVTSNKQFKNIKNLAD